MSIDITVTYRTKGPIFDGRAPRAVREFAEQLRHDVASAGETGVIEDMTDVFQHPTGYMQGNVNVDRRGPADVVNGNGVIYTHWLNGTGSRNYPVTRFKGYGTWKRVARKLRRRVPLIAKKTIQPYILRMGGR